MFNIMIFHRIFFGIIISTSSLRFRFQGSLDWGDKQLWRKKTLYSKTVNYPIIFRKNA